MYEGKYKSYTIYLVFNLVISSCNDDIFSFNSLYKKLFFSISDTIKDISISDNFSLTFKYFLALILCSFNGSKLVSNSFIMSLTLFKLLFVLSNLRIASSFLLFLLLLQFPLLFLLLSFQRLFALSQEELALTAFPVQRAFVLSKADHCQR